MSVSLILKPGGKAQCLAEVAVDGHTMLLIGSAIVALLFIVDVMLGSGGISVPRWARERTHPAANVLRWRQVEWMRRQTWRATSSKWGRSLISLSLDSPCRRCMDCTRLWACFRLMARSFSTA